MTHAPPPPAPAPAPPGPDVFVGLMSGTSCDGISAAVVRFVGDRARVGGEGSAELRDPRPATPHPQLLAFTQLSYSAAQRARLLAAMERATPAEYTRLDAELGAWLADAAAEALAESGVARADVRAVASHGHTIWHEPGCSTWQLGQAAVIAERLGVDVVSDFRVRDMAAGGQGAPLVPVADALLFAGDDWRALQNIGGIGNVTVVPPRGGDEGARLAAVRAFDTGPGVAVIDAVARRVDPALPYDVDGRLAAAGRAIDAVVDELLAEPYFLAPPPKSTGRELFSAAYVERLVARCRAASPDARGEDLVATATLLTARSIADAYRRFLPEPLRDVLLSGGGARNPTLVAAIEAELARALGGDAARAVPRVARFDDAFFDGEAKEAVAFAFLGWLHVAGRPGNVPTATGARGPRRLGVLTPAG